jgi:hypothetical protein
VSLDPLSIIIKSYFGASEQFVSTDFLLPSLFKIAVVSYNKCKFMEKRGDFYASKSIQPQHLNLFLCRVMRIGTDRPLHIGIGTY